MYNQKINYLMKVKFLQEGGAAPAPAPAPGAEAQAGPEEQISAMAQQVVEQMGPEAAIMLAQAILDMAQGGGAPAQEAPVYARKGGKLVLVGKKK